MYLLRNVHDPVPSRMGLAQVAGLAKRVREGLGVVPGAGVAKAFGRLGGTYEQVVSTFGRRTDRIVIRGASDFTYEDEDYPEEAAFGLAECLGVLFLHHPLVVRAYGEDAVTAVPRFTPAGDGEAVTREAIWFAVHFAMPADAVRAAHAADPDPRALGRAFHVRPQTAARRARSLGLGVDGLADAA